MFNMLSFNFFYNQNYNYKIREKCNWWISDCDSTTDESNEAVHNNECLYYMVVLKMASSNYFIDQPDLHTLNS